VQQQKDPSDKSDRDLPVLLSASCWNSHFNVVSSSGWRSDELQVEIIWVCLEKFLSKQVELWVEGKEWRTFWYFGLWLHLLLWLLTLSFHVLW